MMKKYISLILVCLLLICAMPSVVAVQTQFKDVKRGDWFYETVTEMVDRGLFVGKSADEFCPDDPMTRAEFLTVVLRLAHPECDLTPWPGETWWQAVYRVGLSRYLFYDSLYFNTEESFCAPIPREEMAQIIYEVCQRMGAYKTKVPYFYAVPDIDETANSARQYAIRVVYGQGIITGIDDKGTFAPRMTLTRGQAATILYRTAEATKEGWPPITIYEGQVRYNRNARAGDTFVKKDGTSIVLKLDQYGILGGGQGVAPDVGLFGIVKENGCDSFTYMVSKYGILTDSMGQCIQNGRYRINATTGEGYWVREHQTLSKYMPAPDREGYDGEISSDPYHLYIWKYGDWWYNDKH